MFISLIIMSIHLQPYKAIYNLFATKPKRVSNCCISSHTVLLVESISLFLYENIFSKYKFARKQSNPDDLVGHVLAQRGHWELRRTTEHIHVPQVSVSYLHPCMWEYATSSRPHSIICNGSQRRRAPNLSLLTFDIVFGLLFSFFATFVIILSTYTIHANIWPVKGLCIKTVEPNEKKIQSNLFIFNTINA
jgi:hypothetical protein